MQKEGGYLDGPCKAVPSLVPGAEQCLALGRDHALPQIPPETEAQPQPVQSSSLVAPGSHCRGCCPPSKSLHGAAAAKNKKIKKIILFGQIASSRALFY